MLRDVTGAIAGPEERVVTLGLRLGYCDVRGRGSIQMLRLLLIGCVLPASGAPSCAWFPYVTRSSDAPPTRKSCSPFGTRMGDRLTSA
jgi:hypothetical protein